MFRILKKSKLSRARLCEIKTAHGRLSTPCFLPDATRAVIKGLAADELNNLGLDCLVANTLHLYLRPGLKIIKQAGGLHKFMDWPGVILTDSGGYQVFSLIHKSRGKITGQAAFFRSPLDGRPVKLTPELSIKIQLELGADIVVCLDDCPPNDYPAEKLAQAVERTIGWAGRCRRAFDRAVKSAGRAKRPLLLAVIQGGADARLREKCARELNRLGFDGYGFGARHIDENGKFLSATLSKTAELIPENKLRFGLGIGLPEDILRAVKMGWDAFDCVIPTREGRHGRLFIRRGGIRPPAGRRFYETANLTNAKFARDFSPINPLSALNDLRQYSKAYLHYLFKLHDPLAGRLASLNNLEFYLKMLSETRTLISRGKL